MRITVALVNEKTSETIASSRPGIKGEQDAEHRALAERVRRIRELAVTSKFVLTDHAELRSVRREVTREDAAEAIKTGLISYDPKTDSFIALGNELKPTYIVFKHMSNAGGEYLKIMTMMRASPSKQAFYLSVTSGKQFGLQPDGTHPILVAGTPPVRLKTEPEAQPGQEFFKAAVLGEKPRPAVNVDAVLSSLGFELDEKDVSGVRLSRAEERISWLLFTKRTRTISDAIARLAGENEDARNECERLCHGTVDEKRASASSLAERVFNHLEFKSGRRN